MEDNDRQPQEGEAPQEQPTGKTPEATATEPRREATGPSPEESPENTVEAGSEQSGKSSGESKGEAQKSEGQKWIFPEKVLPLPGRTVHALFPGITPRRTLLTSLHAIWMILFVLLWLGHVNHLDGFGFMNDYFSMRSFVNQYILHKTPGSDLPEKFLLLNSSRNNALVPLDNDHLTNAVITDRRMLAEKLRILDQNAGHIQFIICDIFLESPAADAAADSLLQEVLTSLDKKKKIVIPAWYNDVEKEVTMPVFAATTGLSQYRSSFLNTQFLKYSFIPYDGWRQLPLIAWEAVSGKPLVKKGKGIFTWYTHDGKWVLNTVIPEFRYSQDLISEGENYFQLGLFEEYLLGENQVVIIGDIEGRNDIHTSVTGMDAGPVILMNLYASLAEGDHVIPTGYLILLFLVFFYVTYHTFFHRREIPEGESRFRKIIALLWNQRCYFILLLLVYLSMIVFHHYIHILILLSYFGVIDLADRYILNRK